MNTNICSFCGEVFEIREGSNIFCSVCEKRSIRSKKVRLKKSKQFRLSFPKATLDKLWIACGIRGSFSINNFIRDATIILMNKTLEAERDKNEVLS